MKKHINTILVGALVLAIIITLAVFAIAEKAIVATAYSDKLTGKTVLVEYDVANVRSEPHRRSDTNVLFTLEKDAEVTFTGNLYEGNDHKGNHALDNWLEIQAEDGETAWINADAVRTSVDLAEYDFQPVEINPLPYIIAMLVEILFFIIAMVILNKKTSACKS